MVYIVLLKKVYHNLADFVINNSLEDVKARVIEYTGATGASHVIEAIGNYELINQAFSYLQNEGKIGIYGASYPVANLNWAIAPPTWSINQNYSHVLPLEEVKNGFELLRNKKALKVVIKLR